jgi:four helix bundle protein
MSFTTFEDLEAWKLGRELRKDFLKLTKTFPSEEKYRLTDQVIRASRSVTNNIAEGFGRFHYQENIQFCRQSRGSLMELLDHLYVASDDEYIKGEQFNLFKSKILNCIKVLNGYIFYLKKAKDNTQ